MGVICYWNGCELQADLSIRTTNPATKQGFVTTIYMVPEDAPQKANWYCVHHGMQLAADIAKLSNPKARRHLRGVEMPR